MGIQLVAFERADGKQGIYALSCRDDTCLAPKRTIIFLLWLM
ncbi:MAG TPA: hypothetical protein V6C98_01130 [Thermosynechococcaceae cyanobacterium]